MCLTLGILARLGVLKILEPGPFGWIGLILTMSFLLIREYQQQLVTSENRFRSLVEQSPLSIQIINRQGQTIRTNSAWQQIFSHYPIIFDLKEQLQQGFTGTAQSLTPRQYQISHNNSLKFDTVGGLS